MTWVLFCDESGHDQINTPLEVRGGLAFHVDQIGAFSADFEKLRLEVFGKEFVAKNHEIKGNKLLSRRIFQFAGQEEQLSRAERINGVNLFLKASEMGKSPPARGFSAYGQACLLFADRLFKRLEKFQAVIFASAVPRGTKLPRNYQHFDFLRKDSVFLQERFFYFLEDKDASGFMVFDQIETQQDKRYIKRLRDYYTKTQNGRKRAKRICPMPLFVDSELSPCIQAADVCLYCINWGFRRPEWGFDGDRRNEIAEKYAGICGRLQYQGIAYNRGQHHPTHGIIFVSDPFPVRS